jgi:hypothetical protein
VTRSEEQAQDAPGAATLLAVDVGLRGGLAVFGADGRLRSYRSCHVPTRAALRKASWTVLGETEGVKHVVLEGGGPLADIWERNAERRGAAVLRVAAHEWRRELMLTRSRRSGRQAKDVACRAARQIIEWSGAPRPTSLRHDAAEAILVGLWGVLTVGWLGSVPDCVFC